MIGELWSYLGPIGIASMLAWLAALGGAAVAAIDTRRLTVGLFGGAAALAGGGLAYLLAGRTGAAAWAACLIAAVVACRHWSAARVVLAGLALAVVGYGAARLNSARISAIEVDRSEMIEAARRQKQQALRQETEALRSRAADIHFVEDAPRDRLDVAGLTTNKAQTVLDDTEPEYRKRGKRQRDPGRQTGPAAGDEPVTTAPATSARRLPERQVRQANRLDRINLLATRLTLLVVAAAAVGGYLLRFNSVGDALFPVPIGGPLIDTIVPKAHHVSLSIDAAGLRRLLESAVRKGETFILFAPADPWPAVSALPRLPFTKLTIPLWKWTPAIPGWMLPKISVLADAPAPDAEFIFETAWFGRCASVVLGRPHADAVLPEVVELLQQRHRTRAAARHTVNLVWALPDAPDPATFEALSSLGPPANLRLITVNAAADAG